MLQHDLQSRWQEASAEPKRWRPRRSMGVHVAIWLSVIALPAVATLAQARTRTAGSTDSPSLPEIRTHASNRVPACVTPDRLDAFLASKNPRLEGKFKGIAAHYKKYGETYGVRWDFAFYQMLLETNHLSFMRSPGRPGDVRARQNNFAGIGATGGGVPGESYPDVPTGVLVQIQHLVAYSGDRVENAASPRTRENQDDIIRKSKRLGRAVTYRDLVNRWAMDRNYARSITIIADAFRNEHCNRSEPIIEAKAASPQSVETASRPSTPRSRPPEPQPEVTAATPSTRTSNGSRSSNPSETTTGSLPDAGTRRQSADCKVWSASFGGRKALLVKNSTAGTVSYTALEVVDGFENSMLQTFVATHAPGGKAVAEFETQKDALAHAFTLCRTNAGAEERATASPRPG